MSTDITWGYLILSKGKKIGTYSLMQNTKVNDPNEGVTPLSVKDVTDLGWLDMNDATRVQTVTANTSVTLQPLRSPTGIVAAKVVPDANYPYSYFLIANHQRSANPYDGTYPADGLLIWQIHGAYGPDALDIECAVGLDPLADGFNKDHLDLYDYDPANFHGEGLASDFFNPSGQNQFTPWTNPNTDLPGNNPSPTYLAVTNITSNGNSMSFDVIYNFFSGIITVDSWWKDTPFINGNVTVNAGKTVTVIPGATAFLPDNYTFTLNPGATLYVDGTLRIETNTTITGGGSIIKRGSGEIKQTWSDLALASNNSRKLARDSNGNYHLVFESDGEICYEKLINGGTAIGEFRRISAGNGGNTYPCIAVRDNRVYVVWQRFDGANYDVHFRKSTDGGGAWSTIQQVGYDIAVSTVQPVIVSPATDKLTIAFRADASLRYRVSENDGSSWTSGAVPSTGTNDYSPSLAPTMTYWGSYRSALVWARTDGNGSIRYRYYKNGTDSTGWNSITKNLSQIVPGSYNSHKNPSIAPSGSPGDKRLHIVWEARSGTSGNSYVIIHRKATDWYTWSSVYSVTYYEEQQQPSVTGLHDDTAELLFKMVSQNSIYNWAHL